MASKTELDKHKETCKNCVELSFNNWDLCEEGQRLFREEPFPPPIKVAMATRDKHNQPKRPNIKPPKKKGSEL